MDTTGWANPRIQVVIGAGGTGAVNGSGDQAAAGVAGAARYSYDIARDIPADVLPLEPTATGTISKVGLSTTFPGLGAGLWVLHVDGEVNMDIGLVDVGPGPQINMRTGTITFISSRTPVLVSSAWNSNKTIKYAFYSMGNWG